MTNVAEVQMSEKIESKKKEERWKPAEVERFLELYEMYPCLWDYKSPEYKDRNVKEHSWEEIVKYMDKQDLTVKKAKDKIRVFRNTYSNELMKIQKSKSSGNGLDDVYTPTLRWFSTMHRIVGQVVQSRGSQSVGLPDENLPDTQQEENRLDKVDEPDATEIPRDEDTFETLPPATHSTPNVTRIPREKPATVTRANNPYVRPISKKVADQRLNKIETAVSELKAISTQVVSHGTSLQRKCEFDMFGQLVSTQLKKLPEVEALAAMQEIQTRLIQRRLAYANRSMSTSQEPLWDVPEYNTNTDSNTISSPSVTQEDSNCELGNKDMISFAFSMISDES